MPGSGAVHGDALTAPLLPTNWEKPLTELEQRHFLFVQSLRGQQGWRLWDNFFGCFLCLCSTSRRMQVIGNHWTEHWLIAHHTSAQVCKQNGWQGMMWLVELAWNFSERAVPWTWQGDVWHGSWIYRTGPYSPKQVKDTTSFFCCPTWLVFFCVNLFSPHAYKMVQNRFVDIQQSSASVASATSLRSFPNGFLEISVLSPLQPDQDGTKCLTFRTHS